jgi:tetratricopeptide (TPR) repeat protein
MNLIRRWSYVQIARWALTFKKRDFARACYEKIVADDPRDAQTRACIAFLDAEDGNVSRAIDEFERVVAITPDDTDSWFNLGYLQQSAGDHALAIGSFDRAIAINERHDRAWFGKALSLITLTRHDEAIEPLKKNIALQPLSPHGHVELARCYFRLGDRDRCEKQMRKLREFDPKNGALLEDETGIRIGIKRWWHVDAPKISRSDSRQ